MKKAAMRAILALFVLGYLLVFFQKWMYNAGVYQMTHWEYLTARTNLIPLTTIVFYIKSLVGQTINTDICVRFFLLAIGAGVPLGLLLPAAFEKLQRLRAFLGAMIALLLVKEAAEVLLMIGSFDVDSILLSLLGAAAGWFLWDLARRMQPALRKVA